MYASILDKQLRDFQKISEVSSMNIFHKNY